MADSVIARQQGDDYQARYFWLKACELYRQNTTATRIQWEMSEGHGFDDIAVYHQGGRLDSHSGNLVEQEYYQVKYHVNHSSGFTCELLMDPTFIGNKTESLLQRLLVNFRRDPNSYAHSLYYIVNTWGLVHADPIAKIVGNNGAIVSNYLFDGSTDASAMGQVRKKWREHLGLASDDELKPILAQLRIVYNAPLFDDLTSHLNAGLELAGLSPISSTQRSCIYTGLIQKLHAEGRKTFTKEELWEILVQEKLHLEKKAVVDNRYTAGVRTFQRGTENLPYGSADFLCLLQHFQGRFAIDEKLWGSNILPALESFSTAIIAKGGPVVMHLDTHLTLAFALGYHLDSKSGIGTTIVQKTRAGRIEFNVDPNSDGYRMHAGDTNWQIKEDMLEEEANDVALIVNITHDIYWNVFEYLSGQVTGVRRIISASILDRPSGAAIRDGNHLAVAVDQLVTELRFRQTAVERQGRIHLFIAAPNAFAFTLGQNFRSFGAVRLYEFDFENARTGTYLPSIDLPKQ